MTFNNKKSLALLVFLAVVAALVLAPSVSGQSEQGCCTEASNGAFCQEVPENECSGQFSVGDSCESNPFEGQCETISATDQDNYQCVEASRAEVEGSSHLEEVSSGSNICRTGCCIVDGSGTQTTKLDCTRISNNAGVQINFTTDLDRTQCENLVKSQQKGACVLSGGDCEYGTRQECNNNGGSFHAETYCSDPSLRSEGVSCISEDHKQCSDGDVYWYDSCGNKEEIASQCVDGQETCAVNNDGEPVCRDLSCGEEALESAGLDPSNLPDGKNELKNSESVCYYGGRTGFGTDPVGSEHYRVTCSQGEVIKASCGTGRKGVCKQSETEQDGVDVQRAYCVPNQAATCLGITSKHFENMDEEMNNQSKGAAREDWRSTGGPPIQELQEVSRDKSEKLVEARSLCRQGEGCIFDETRDVMCSDGSGGECDDPGEGYNDVENQLESLQDEESDLRSEWAEAGSPYEQKLHNHLSNMQKECNSNPSCMFSYAGYEDKANHFPLGACLPKYPREIEVEGESSCNQMSVSGKVVYRKTSSGRFRCVENCKLLHPQTFANMNSMCAAAGDCGLTQNIEGEWSRTGLSYEPTGRQLMDGNAFVRSERVGTAESISQNCAGLDRCEGGSEYSSGEQAAATGSGAVGGCAAGAAAGAQAGGLIGSVALPGLGTVTGGTLGAVSGCITGAVLGGVAGSGATQNDITKEWLKWTIVPPRGEGDRSSADGWSATWDDAGWNGCTSGDFEDRGNPRACKLELGHAIIKEAIKRIKGNSESEGYNMNWNETAEAQSGVAYTPEDAIRMSYSPNFLEQALGIDTSELTEEEINQRIRQSVQSNVSDEFGVTSQADINAIGIQNLLSDEGKFRDSYIKKRRRKEIREDGGLFSSWRGSAKGNYWLGGDSETVDVEYNCQPYQPSTNADCSKCSGGPMGCTQYKCQSLGSNCKAINNGTNHVQCVERVNDEQGPSVEGIEFVGDNSISQQGSNWEIDNNVVEDSEISFNVTLDEPSVCRYSKESHDNYDNMPANMPDTEGRRTEHTFTADVPQLASIVGENYELGMEENLNFSVRCIDYHGNPTQNEEVIDYTAEAVPDTFPPEIENFNPSDEFSWPYNPENFSLRLDVSDDSWPVSCRYSFNSGATFENMQNSMACGQSSSTNSCFADINDTTVGTHDIYVKCSDNRSNVNDGEVYQYEVERDISYEDYVQEHGLSIDAMGLEINGEEYENNASLKTNSDPAEVAFNLETSGGVNEGVSTCSYRLDSNDPYREFDNTESQSHSNVLDYLRGSFGQTKDYEISVLCEDRISNVTDEVNFSLEFDRTAPQIISNSTEEGGDLTITTGEPAQCSYSPGTCDFDLENGEAFSFGSRGDYVEEQSVEWNPSQAYHVRCRDELGNEGCTRINAADTINGPQITRIWEGSGELRVRTDRDAQCYFNFNSCNFNILQDPENEMSGGSVSTTHSTDWNPSNTYYIKCKDEWDNPNPSCAAIVQPHSL